MIQHDQGVSTASLEVLGDLFFSAPARRRPQKPANQPEADDNRRHHAAPAATAASAAPDVPHYAADSGVKWRPLDDCDFGRQGKFCQKLSRRPRSDAQTSRQANHKTIFHIPKKLEMDLLVLLAGGLPPCGRLKAAWAAMRRLSPEDGRMLVLTITDSAAWLQRCGRWEDCHAQTTDNGDSGDHDGDHRGDLHSRFERFLSEADGLVIVAADPAAALIRAVTLPAARIVLAEGGKDGAIAAYCELKAAALDAQPAELFVIDGDDGRDAEQVYRRLAQVAISHLEMSPTFAGHARRLTDADCPGEDILPLTLDQAAQLLSAAAIDRHRPDGIDPLYLPDEAPPPPPPPAPRRNPQPEAPQEDAAAQRPVSRHIDGVFNPDWPMPGSAADASQTPDEPPARPPDEPPPPEKCRPRPVGQGDFQNFSAWSPQSRDELLEAVRAALPAALPQIANIFDPKDLADEADLPDLLVFDACGAVAGLVASLDGSADDAARAAAAADWLRRYARLLSRACCESTQNETAADGDESAGTAQAARAAVMVPPVWLLVPQQRRKASERLNLPQIGLLTWHGVSFGGSCGVIIEHCGNLKSQGCQTDCPPQQPEKTSSNALPPTSAPRAVRVEQGLAVSLVREQQSWSQEADDDGLTPDELEALKKNLKIEEMT